MLNLAVLNPILVHLFTNQILLISIMGKCSKEFRSMRNRSNCIFKSFLVVLLIISIVQISESNVEDVTENTIIETDNLQSNEEKTEEPLQLMNQIAYFQGTEKSVAIQQADDIVPAGMSELNSNSLLSFIPERANLASDDDDNEQNDAQDSYLVADTGIKGNTKLLTNSAMRPMVKLLRGNRMLLKQPLISSDRQSLIGDKIKTLVEDPAKTRKLYLSEIERIRGYLPSLMKLKRLVKKCQCSYSDEDQYSSIKDAMMPNRMDHRINLDYVDGDEESDDDERDDDDDSPPSDILRQRGFNFDKYKRFDLNQNLREDEDLDDEEDEFENFNELKNEEDRNTEENSSDPFEDRDSSDESSSEESLEEYEESDENMLKDEQLNNSVNNPEQQNNDIENSKLLSPFMANMSPTSSSDIIFNELSMQDQQDSEENDNEIQNEIQLAKLKKANGQDASMNNSNLVSSNSLEASANTLSTQYAMMQSRGGGSSKGGGSKGGGGRGGGSNKRNLFDHWILIRKRRQISRSNQKKGSSSSKSGSRNFY